MITNILWPKVKEVSLDNISHTQQMQQLNACYTSLEIRFFQEILILNGLHKIVIK